MVSVTKTYVDNTSLVSAARKKRYNGYLHKLVEILTANNGTIPKKYYLRSHKITVIPHIYF